MRELDTALALVTEAAGAVMDIYEQDFSVETKADNSPLTRADLAADRIIREGLREAFPDHGILTEESKDGPKRLEKEQVWIIDPIDGTKEFIKRNGEFTINIGLARNGNPVLGVIYAPAIDELYYGIIGEGAWKLHNGNKTPIRPSTNTTIQTLAISRSHSSTEEQKLIEELGIPNVLAKGSSLKGCMVASGEADAYIRYGNINEWDICAMHAIIEAAGARITKFDGTDIKYNKANPLIRGGFRAAAPNIQWTD